MKKTDRLASKWRKKSRCIASLHAKHIYAILISIIIWPRLETCVPNRSHKVRVGGELKIDFSFIALVDGC